MSQRKSKRKSRPAQAVTIDNTVRSLVSIWKRAQRSLELDGEEHEQAYIDHLLRFGDLAQRTWERGKLGTVADTIRSLSVGEDHGTLALDLAEGIDILNALTEAHSGALIEAQRQDGTSVLVQTSVFGISAVGSVDAAVRLTQSDFVRLIRAHGMVPEKSNVCCLGVLPCGPAMDLGQDPQKVWQLAQTLYTRQCTDLHNVAVPGLIQSLSHDGEESQTTVGGYVLLMGVFSAHEDDAQEGLNGEDREGLEHQWVEAAEAFLRKNGLENQVNIGQPQELHEAARDALAGQLELGLDIMRAMDRTTAAPPSDLDQVCFVVNLDDGAIDVVGHFSDGFEACLSRVMPVFALAFLEDIASRMAVEDVHMVAQGDRFPWQGQVRQGKHRSHRLH